MGSFFQVLRMCVPLSEGLLVAKLRRCDLLSNLLRQVVEQIQIAAVDLEDGEDDEGGDDGKQ